ncbi:unnamed protein product [Sympodiomycopsis kandeliae]
MKSALSFTALVGLYTAFAQAAPSQPAYDSRFEARTNHDRQMAKKSVADSPSAFAAKEYDYVIVGAGTAGLAVAAKLSENGKYTVGVLESGPDGFGDPVNLIPGQFGANLATKYDYNYTTVANTQTGVPSKGWPRGHVVGGSSILNFLVWDAASKKEYDAWEQLGNAGWNWDSLNSYMQAAETFTAPSQSQQEKLNQKVNPSNYGHKGAVDASFPKYVSKQVSNWIPALQSLGIPVNNEPLAGDNTGASLQPSNINPKNSTRDSSATAYYYPNNARRNLSLLPNARVDKIVFSDKVCDEREATGVKFTSGGKTYTVKAKKEVIVSGGAVNSPQILELSGIGSSSVLKKAGIKQIIDNPNVGENLQDHTYSFTSFELKDGATVTLDSLRNNATFAAEQKDLYSKNQASILDETVPAIAYISLDRLMGKTKAASAVKDAQSYVSSVNAPYKATLQKQIEWLTKNTDDISQMELIGIDGFFAGAGAPAAGKTYVTFLSASQHLLARGSVHVDPKSPASSAPLIQPNYYNNKFDREVAVAGVQYLRKIAGTSQYGSYITSETVPGSSVSSDADIEKFVTTTGFVTEYHPIGTASMLPRNAGGVVDANLKVYGTANVRVIDGAVIPLHVSAHIQRTIYGVALKGADIILKTA